MFMLYLTCPHLSTTLIPVVLFPALLVLRVVAPSLLLLLVLLPLLLVSLLLTNRVLPVHDEYGHFEGIVTPNDLLAAIAGEFASDQAQGSAPNIITLDDGSMLVSGAMSADAMADALSIDLPEDRDYATAAGHVLHILRHLPVEGESFRDQGWHFEVVDMDGRKIDKLRVRLAEKATRTDAVEGL